MTSPRSDTGSATVEFIGLTVILLIPAIYLLIIISQLQAAGYAAVAASDQAAKAIGFSTSAAQGQARAHQTVALTAQNFDIDPARAHTRMRCHPAACTTPGTRISVEVSIEVPLPLVPTFFGNQTRIATMRATGYHVIGAFE